MRKFPVLAFASVLLVGLAIAFAEGNKPKIEGWLDFNPDQRRFTTQEEYAERRPVPIEFVQWNIAVALREAAQADYRRASAEERIAAALERIAVAMEKREQ